MNKLDAIKAKQLEQARQSGFDPYLDAAAGKLSPDALKTQPVPSRLADYQAKLAVDLGKISAEPDIEKKQRIKALVLPDYLDFIDDYAQSGVNYPNDVAVYVMIWLLDTGDLKRGLPLAYHLIKQNQKLPGKFDRTMPVFLCDFVYDYANALLKNNTPAIDLLRSVLERLEQAQWDVHPVVRGKLYVMLAKHYELDGDYKEALEAAKTAQKINPDGAGVKGLIERCEKMLNKAPLAGDGDGNS